MSTLRKIGDFFDGFIVYVAAVVGILFSRTIRMMGTGEVMKVDLSLIRIVVAMIIALVLVNRSDQISGTGEQRAKSREGRRRNLKNRAVSALGQGFMWSQVTGIGE